MNLLLKIPIILVVVVLQFEGRHSKTLSEHTTETLEINKESPNKLSTEDAVPDEQQKTIDISKLEESSQGKNIIEGDIMVLPDEERNSKRSLLTNSVWPMGILYYQIASMFTSSEKATINRAMATIAEASCVKFQQRTTENYWVQFIREQVCSSYVGRIGESSQPQPIKLAPGCFGSFGTICHEILHALGILHEQSRPDRDDFVKINWQNIITGAGVNFNKYPYSKTLGRNYDYKSVMHYRRTAFSKNGQNTIETLDKKYMDQIGQRVTISTGDIIDLNLMYRCKGKTNYVGQWTQFDPCTSNCTQSRQRWCGNPANCSNVDVNGLETQTIPCATSICTTPVDGNWGHWTTFKSCVKTSLNETTTRTRTCSNPPAKNGGRQCSGPSSQTTLCQCGGEYSLTDQPSFIESPGFPASYLPSQNCTYQINAPTGTIVKLTFSTFELEVTAGCKSDSVTIYGESSKLRQIKKLCSGAQNKSFQSTNSKMVIVFKSDAKVANKGFRAKLEAMKPAPTTVPPPPPKINIKIKIEKFYRLV